MKYGEQEILDFDINAKENYWDNNHPKNYTIDIELPEFMCKCPRSGYPDFATIKLSYCPDEYVIELKALKLYINSFMNRKSLMVPMSFLRVTEKHETKMDKRG
ncbi:hypothetical protein LSH36_3417g00004 [Paralvinella palmiformis]|uniref:PreQ(1) synthase n=1 Tax=Paralvinella palmiformis TaxID=53620 RepID=A0AAD9IPA0_9ANNE|nr:hypothetical protein LSH36_3417g00004 [Paralvinella palmiformis]